MESTNIFDRQNYKPIGYGVIFLSTAVLFIPFVAELPAGRLHLSLSSKVRPQAISLGPAYTTKTMRVSAYCSCPKCCGKCSDGITANGHKIKEGDRFVAASRTYPFGTKMLVPGYGGDKPVEVKDRGGAIKGARLDVYFDSHQAALNWGVQYLEVRIYD